MSADATRRAGTVPPRPGVVVYGGWSDRTATQPREYRSNLWRVEAGATHRRRGMRRQGAAGAMSDDTDQRRAGEHGAATVASPNADATDEIRDHAMPRHLANDRHTPHEAPTRPGGDRHARAEPQQRASCPREARAPRSLRRRDEQRQVASRRRPSPLDAPHHASRRDQRTASSVGRGQAVCRRTRAPVGEGHDGAGTAEPVRVATQPHGNAMSAGGQFGVSMTGAGPDTPRSVGRGGGSAAAAAPCSAS